MDVSFHMGKEEWKNELIAFLSFKEVNKLPFQSRICKTRHFLEIKLAFGFHSSLPTFPPANFILLSSQRGILKHHPNLKGPRGTIRQDIL